MSAAAKYGSDNVSLWTPSATGSESLSSDIVAWVDCEDTDNMTTYTDSGHSYVSIIKDKVNDISFGAPNGYHVPKFSNGSDSLLINGRNTLHFWETSQQSTPDSALTASIDAFTGHLAEDNDSRYAFFVYKPLDYYGGSNFLYQYGAGQTGKGYGLAMWVTGSGDLTDTNHYYYMASWGGGKRYYPDESDTNSAYYNNTGRTNLVYHQHNGTSGYMSHDGNQTTPSYSGLTLTTNNFNQDLEFWIGEEIGGGGRGIEFLLAEMILVTGSSFSDTDRQRVEGYLAHKWGCTVDLPSDHPYKSSAPTNGIVNYVPFPNKQTAVEGKRYSKAYVDDGLKQLAKQYDTCGHMEGFVPLRFKVRGPSNIRNRTTVYKVEKG
jgi:hypothetical protein